MCLGCWKEYGSPTIDTPAVREAARLIGILYEVCLAGGSAHVVFDDWNIEDDYIVGALSSEAGAWDTHIKELCDETLIPFKALSIQERASSLALHRGYWGER